MPKCISINFLQLLMWMASATATRTINIWSREDIANVLHCTIHTRIAPAQIAWAKQFQGQPNTVIGKTHAWSPPGMRSHQRPGSDQERETLEEKTALIQSDDEEDVAVNSAASNNAFDDSPVVRESAARNDTFDDSEVLSESEYVMYENSFQIHIRSAAEMSVDNTIMRAVLNVMKVQQELSGSHDQSCVY